MPGGTVTNKWLVGPVADTEAALGKVNAASIVKDILRSENADAILPESFKRKKISVRQRYRGTSTFQVIPYV